MNLLHLLLAPFGLLVGIPTMFLLAALIKYLLMS